MMNCKGMRKKTFFSPSMFKATGLKSAACSLPPRQPLCKLARGRWWSPILYLPHVGPELFLVACQPTETAQGEARAHFPLWRKWKCLLWPLAQMLSRTRRKYFTKKNFYAKKSAAQCDPAFSLNAELLLVSRGFFLFLDTLFICEICAEARMVARYNTNLLLLPYFVKVKYYFVSHCAFLQNSRALNLKRWRRVVSLCSSRWNPGGGGASLPVHSSGLRELYGVSLRAGQ